MLGLYLAPFAKGFLPVSRIQLSIEPVPDWLDIVRLCGPAGDSTHLPLRREPLGAGRYRAWLELDAPEAATIAARLRGLGLDGHALEVRAEPRLARAKVRAALLSEARARRQTTPGFSRPGAKASGEGRYSLTPEALALALGERAGGASVIDACCGSGGNSIGFARAGCTVEAFEIDALRLAEARANARVYGVERTLRFVEGDARLLLPSREAELLFIDPPWGEHYDKRCTTRASFPLLDALLALDLRRFREVWLKVPSSFEVGSVPEARPSAWFGLAPGDRQRIKFVLLQSPGSAFPGTPR